MKGLEETARYGCQHIVHHVYTDRKPSDNHTKINCPNLSVIVQEALGVSLPFETWEVERPPFKTTRLNTNCNVIVKQPSS